MIPSNVVFLKVMFGIQIREKVERLSHLKFKILNLQKKKCRYFVTRISKDFIPLSIVLLNDIF